MTVSPSHAPRIHLLIPQGEAVADGTCLKLEGIISLKLLLLHICVFVCVCLNAYTALEQIKRLL